MTEMTYIKLDDYLVCENYHFSVALRVEITMFQMYSLRKIKSELLKFLVGL